MGYKITASSDGAQIGVSEVVQEILQNVAIILATPRGTVPMYRDFGVSTEFLDMPLPVAKVRMISEIREAVERWEPRATVKEVTFAAGDAANGQLVPIVEVEINGE